MEQRGVESSVAQRQGSGHVQNAGVNGWRGKGKEEPTATDQECEGDSIENDRKRD